MFLECPKCGEEVLALVDAYVVRRLIGFDGEGNPILSTQERIDEFDEVIIECSGCGACDLDWTDFEERKE